MMLRAQLRAVDIKNLPYEEERSANGVFARVYSA